MSAPLPAAPDGEWSMGKDDPGQPAKGREGGRKLRSWIALAALPIAALATGHFAAGYVATSIPADGAAGMRLWIFLAVAVCYAVLLAIPFLPGVEVGLVLIAMADPQQIVFVYLLTLLALSASYLCGRALPLDVTVRALNRLGLRRSAGLLRSLEPLSMEERLGFLVGKAPHRVVPFLLRHRYLALAIVMNMPGNGLIGGGGGIALIAGASGLFGFRGFAATLAVAVAPVPFAFLILGLGGR